jgi:membrane protein required for colicin V production
MNFLDIIMLIPIIWFGFKGLKNGFITELTSILGLFLGFWITLKYYLAVAAWFNSTILAKVIAFIALFILTLVITYLIGKAIEKIINLILPSFVNYLFGLLFGVLKVALLFSVIFYFINSVDKKEFVFKRQVKEKSFLYRYVEPIAVKIVSWQQEDETADIEHQENNI